MKAYKVTGKLGDICSFVGGNEVKKGDMVYFHSESDMKQERVSESQEKREWVGLTDEEVITMSRYDLEYAALIGEVERKLKEKNS